MRALIATLEPIWWMLFGAGGVVASLTVPALLFVVLFAFPLGWFGDAETTFVRMRALFANPIGQGVLLAVLALPLWNAAHHLRHFLMDLGLSPESVRTPLAAAMYGLAGLGTLAIAGLVGTL